MGLDTKPFFSSHLLSSCNVSSMFDYTILSNVMAYPLLLLPYLFVRYLNHLRTCNLLGPVRPGSIDGRPQALMGLEPHLVERHVQGGRMTRGLGVPRKQHTDRLASTGTPGEATRRPHKFYQSYLIYDQVAKGRGRGRAVWKSSSHPSTPRILPARLPTSNR
ncbi:hypothetical protein GGR54DRAFT_143735 [Hypoxylon sp. NC1633]|nr:hypothetical protein GGR54DRAFT_143735 [Hypoxylon sp. NC1633]